MLMSVLGTTAAALERCTEIEEELHQSQVGVLAGHSLTVPLFWRKTGACSLA